MIFSAKSVLRRAQKAYEDRRAWAQLYDQLYTYALPNRRPSSRSGVKTGGQDDTDKVFDSTLPKAAHRFAGRMSRDVTPPFQKHADLAVGPALKSAIAQIVSGQGGDENALKEAVHSAEKDLEDISTKGHAILERANFGLAADEMYLDLFGGQGALLMLEDEVEILQFTSVPVGEIALREDGYGRVRGVYWAKAYEAQDLNELFPGATWSEETQKAISADGAKSIEVMQATEWDGAKKVWHHFIIEQNKPEVFAKETRDMLTSPWLTPRFWKAPGEAHGRGPGLAALPTTKVLNKVTELTLKAVAFAVLGLWTYRNDRVFNAKTARMFPGAMWAVSSNGGPMGPALQRQEMPGRYDVSNIVLQDLRENVKQISFDDALPPDSGSVRSATEIVERMKRLMNDLAGAYPRLLLEIVIPLWQRLIDVMHRRGIIKMHLPIDQLVLKVQITSPIARAQAANDISNIVDWLDMMVKIGGIEAAALAAKIEEIFPAIGRMLGVSPNFIRSPSERDGLMKMVAQIIAAAQMQQQQPAAPANGPPAVAAA